MRKEWEKKGQYLPLARIAWKEGGGKSGWAAAVKHYTKCIAMGGPFILYDGSTENLKALYTIQTYTEHFSEAWSRHQQWAHAASTATATGSGSAAAATADGPEAKKIKTDIEAPASDQAAAAATSAGSGSTAAVASAKKKANKRGADEAGGPPEKKEKKANPLLEYMKPAKDIIALYKSVMVQAHTILSNIECDESWKFAKDDPSRTKDLKQDAWGLDILPHSSSSHPRRHPPL